MIQSMVCIAAAPEKLANVLADTNLVGKRARVHDNDGPQAGRLIASQEHLNELDTKV